MPDVDMGPLYPTSEGPFRVNLPRGQGFYYNPDWLKFFGNLDVGVTDLGGKTFRVGTVTVPSSVPGFFIGGHFGAPMPGMFDRPVQSPGAPGGPLMPPAGN